MMKLIPAEHTRTILDELKESAIHPIESSLPRPSLLTRSDLRMGVYGKIPSVKIPPVTPPLGKNPQVKILPVKSPLVKIPLAKTPHGKNPTFQSIVCRSNNVITGSQRHGSLFGNPPPY